MSFSLDGRDGDTWTLFATQDGLTIDNTTLRIDEATELVRALGADWGTREPSVTDLEDERDRLTGIAADLEVENEALRDELLDVYRHLLAAARVIGEEG